MPRFALQRQVLARCLLALLATVSVVAVADVDTPQPLPALNIDIHQTSVSGISSGGFMSVQFQVAHSSIVKGAGIVAAGPYYCAQGNVITATTQCTCTLDPMNQVCVVSPTSTNVPALVAATRNFATQNLIDDPANIAQQRVFTFTGGKDAIVPSPVVTQLQDYFNKLGLPAANLQATTLANAGHTMPTTAYGSTCPTTDEPYINKCQFDAAGKILNWIYGPLKPARTGAAKGRFIQFDQKPYAPQGGFLWTSGLDTSGWLYVPTTCSQGQACRLHIALHGCKQGQSYLPLNPLPGGGLYYGTTFVKHAGYDTWADTNNLVILFPQAVTIPLQNPNGCWDWWGYTGEHYADKQGVQIQAIRAMVDRLSSGVQ